MGVDSLFKTVTRQRRGCDLNSGLSALSPATELTIYLTHLFSETHLTR